MNQAMSFLGFVGFLATPAFMFIATILWLFKAPFPKKVWAIKLPKFETREDLDNYERISYLFITFGVFAANLTPGWWDLIPRYIFGVNSILLGMCCAMQVLICYSQRDQNGEFWWKSVTTFLLAGLLGWIGRISWGPILAFTNTCNLIASLMLTMVFLQVICSLFFWISNKSNCIRLHWRNMGEGDEYDNFIPNPTTRQMVGGYGTTMGWIKHKVYSFGQWVTHLSEKI